MLHSIPEQCSITLRYQLGTESSAEVSITDFTEVFLTMWNCRGTCPVEADRVLRCAELYRQALEAGDPKEEYLLYGYFRALYRLREACLWNGITPFVYLDLNGAESLGHASFIEAAISDRGALTITTDMGNCADGFGIRRVSARWSTYGDSVTPQEILYLFSQLLEKARKAKADCPTSIEIEESEKIISWETE